MIAPEPEPQPSKTLGIMLAMLASLGLNLLFLVPLLIVILPMVGTGVYLVLESGDPMLGAAGVMLVLGPVLAALRVWSRVLV